MIRISGFPLYISIRPEILTCFPSMSDSSADFETGDAGGIQPVKVWLRIACADVQEGVAAFRCEDLGDDSFNRRVFADVCCCFVGWGNGRRLGLGGRKNRLRND